MRKIVFIAIPSAVIVAFIVIYLTVTASKRAEIASEKAEIAAASEKARVSLKKAFPEFTVEKIAYLPKLDEYRLEGFSTKNYAGKQVNIKKLTLKGLKTEPDEEILGWMGLGARRIALKQVDMEDILIDGDAAVSIGALTLKDMDRSSRGSPTFSKLTLKNVVFGDFTFQLETDYSNKNLHAEGSVKGLNGSFKADLKEHKTAEDIVALKVELAFDTFTLKAEAYTRLYRFLDLTDIVDSAWLESWRSLEPVTHFDIKSFNVDYKDNGFLAEYLAVDSDRADAFYRFFAPQPEAFSEVKIGFDILDQDSSSFLTARNIIRALFLDFCTNFYFVGMELKAVLNGEATRLTVPSCYIGGDYGDYGDDWEEEDCERNYYGDCVDEGEDEWNSDTPFTHEAEAVEVPVAAD